MDITSPWAAGLAPTVAVLGGLLMIWQHRRWRGRVRRDRSLLFEQCSSLLEGFRLQQRGLDYPRVQGSFEGLRVRMEAFVDTLALRSIPPLWLVIDAAIAPGPTGSVELLLEPNGSEAFTLDDELPRRFAAPADLTRASICRGSDDAAVPPLLERMADAARELLADPASKYLAVTPGRLRYVVRIARCDRHRYAVLREVSFGNLRLTPAFLSAKLAALQRLAVALEARA